MCFSGACGTGTLETEIKKCLLRNCYRLDRSIASCPSLNKLTAGGPALFSGPCDLISSPLTFLCFWHTSHNMQSLTSSTDL